MIALALCVSQFAQAQANKQTAKEVAKYSREGFEATEGKKIGTKQSMPSARRPSLIATRAESGLGPATQENGIYDSATVYPEAIAEFSEALKLKPDDAGVYERRAYVEMKTNDYDKALADYSEAIKLKPKEVRYYLFRSYIYETKGDIKNSMADTEQALKLDPNNQEATSRKARLEKIQSLNAPPLPPQPVGSPKASPAAARTP